MSSFWSMWIIFLTVITFLGLTWLLFSNRKRDLKENERTTGHTSDGIEEWDNPLPAWWFYMFVITLVWGVGYLIAYPGLGNFPGLLGWTQIEQYQEEVTAAETRYRAMRDKYLAMPVAEISDDPNLRRMGQRLFANNCAQCHGADAKGAYGFPNLTDSNWIWGGSPEAIKTTLVAGRRAVMPSWSSALGEQGIEEVTSYMLSLNGREAPPEEVAAGEKHYQTYCVACHQADARGNPAMGAPNLTNGIWLYGGTREQIAHTLRNGRNGVMPAQNDLLSEAKIHILTAYVYGFSSD